MNKEISEIESLAFYQDDSNEVPPSDIVAFNELRSCADIHRLYLSKQLEIQPDFQREIVWQPAAQTRFIDSLTKQLPIPSMCISLDYKTDKRLVIDGLQRIQAIINFLSLEDWKLSKLFDIDEKLSGKSVKTIKEKSPELFSRVENLMIPINVIRCDYSKEVHNEYLFTIFHRLNSGGNKLNNQEIRNCIYSGKFNSLLKELVLSKEWANFMSIKTARNYRFSHEEILLRFFAFHDDLSSYNGKLNNFLNSYMFANRKPEEKYITKKKKLFFNTLELMQFIFPKGKIRGKLSKTVLEALLVGVSKNEKYLLKEKNKLPINYFEKFMQLPQFQVENLKEGLSSKTKVLKRLKSSIKFFSNGGHQ